MASLREPKSAILFGPAPDSSKNLSFFCLTGAVQILCSFFGFLLLLLPTGNNPVNPVDPV